MMRFAFAAGSRAFTMRVTRFNPPDEPIRQAP